MSPSVWIRKAPGNETVYKLGHFPIVGEDRDSQTSSWGERKCFMSVTEN